MKTNKVSVEKFQNWLKNSYQKNGKGRFKSWESYGYYLEQAVVDLCINPNQFFAITSAGVMKSVLKALDRSGKFKTRNNKLQSDIKSGFKAYIKFLQAQPSF